MRFFVANRRGRTKPASHLALAIALATGTAVSMVGMAEPAYAMKKKKKEKKAKPEYSDEFIKAYQPLQTLLETEGSDIAGAAALITGILAVTNSGDEKLITGNAIYSIGIKSNDHPRQLEGMKLMLGSGKVEPDQIARFNFIAYQLANSQNDFVGARNYLQQAIDGNFTSENVTADSMRIAMSESYFSEDNYRGGLDYLRQAIAQRKAAGLTVDESWYRRGLTVAYNNEIQPDVYDFVTSWIEEYPSQGNWRDGINIARNLGDFSPPEMLDLMRLGYRLDTFAGKQEYIEYIDAADPRRLPKEVEMVIQNGYATGRVSRDDIFLADSLSSAKSRIASDRADLPALERDARNPSAGLRTVVAAGDAFLSYGEATKAVEFYTKGLSIPGVNTPQVLTRLGIAQTDAGDFVAAQETFAKVVGNRSPIARLWAAYAAEKAVPPAPVPVTPAVPAVEPQVEPAS